MKIEKIVEIHHHDRFGELLYMLHKNNRKYLNDQFAEYNLNLLQSMCMLIMAEHEDISQQQLTELLFLTKSAITKSIGKLETEGYIKRSKSEIDGRQYVLNLTKKGKEIIPTLRKINEDWEESIGVNKLDDDFLENLTKMTYKSIELNNKSQ